MIALLISLQLIACAEPPKDQVLIERFTNNRQSFERLVQLAREPSHVKMEPSGAYSFDENDSTRTMRPIMKPVKGQEPDPRDLRVHSEKLEIMKRLDISWMSGDSSGVTFHATDMLGKFIKGWEFIPDSARQPDSSAVVISLDAIERDITPYDIRYRSLGDGWYLFLLLPHD